jgi:hypothetical protein
MTDKNAILPVAEVISVYDNSEGGRIQVRLLPDDAKLTNAELPFAFPLLPKMIHIRPKVGESVFVIKSDITNGMSNRFYIGPIISQPQFKYKDPYRYSSRSLFDGSIVSPVEAPSMNPNTHGAYPEEDDVAFGGRDNADIIYKDNEVRIRCGVHKSNQADKTDIIFNELDPAYIKLKHSDYKQSYVEKGSGKNIEYRSSVNVVADRINLISHDSKTGFNITDKKDLISDDEMQIILENAHVLPYGDKLVEFLKLFLRAFKVHTHPYAGLPPCQDDNFIMVDSYNLDNILSDSVRIN